MKLGRYQVDFRKEWPHPMWKWDRNGLHIRAIGTMQITWRSK